MFVIYISTNKDVNDYGNNYGYFSGKCYINNGETFPVTDNGITERTKKYKYKGMAIKGAETVYNKCNYVKSYNIEEI